MSIKITIDDRELVKFGKMLPSLKGMFAKDIKLWMTKSLSLLDSAVRVNTPVFLGNLRGAFSTRTQGTPFSRYTGILFNPMVYAMAVEFGRKRGSQPPTGPIELWVRRKLGIGGKEARSVAFLIARAIGKRGIPAVKMAEKGFDRVEPTIISMHDAIPANVFNKFARIS